MSKEELDRRDRAMLMSIKERKRIQDEKERRQGKSKGFASWFST